MHGKYLLSIQNEVYLHPINTSSINGISSIRYTLREHCYVFHLFVCLQPMVSLSPTVAISAMDRFKGAENCSPTSKRSLVLGT